MNLIKRILMLFFLVSCQPRGKNEFLMDINNFILIDVKVNEINKKFIFDTCAEATIISENLAKSLNLKSHRNLRINGKIVEVTYIPILDINGYEFQNVEAAIVDLTNESFVGFEYGGILGLNLLNQFSWEFDLEKSLLTIRKNCYNSIQDNPFSIQYRKVSNTGLPLIALELDFYKSDSLFFDTGFNGFLSLNSNLDTTNLTFIKHTESQNFLYGTERQVIAHYYTGDFNLFNKLYSRELVLLNLRPKRSKDLIGVLSIKRHRKFIFDPICSKIILY